MKIIKVNCCNDCPFFKRIEYLHNQPNACSGNYLSVFDFRVDVYTEVHKNCPLEDMPQPASCCAS